MKRFKVTASSRTKKDVRAASKVTMSRRIVASTLDDDSPEHKALAKYLPPTGEGDNMATQAATAVFKLIYKWFNDGDVYDNSYHMEGWANDLSSYANWLYKYMPETQEFLDQIFYCKTDEAYERILAGLMSIVGDPNSLANYAKEPKRGSVYDCNGPYKWIDLNAEDEDEYDDIPWGDEGEDDEW